MKSFKSLIEKAVNAEGSQKNFAKKIGRSQQFISYLIHEAKNISAETSAIIHIATNGTISKHELRPDIFGPPPVDDNGPSSEKDKEL